MTIEKAFLKSHVLQDSHTDFHTDLFVTERLQASQASGCRRQLRVSRNAFHVDWLDK